MLLNKVDLSKVTDFEAFDQIRISVVVVVVVDGIQLISQGHEFKPFMSCLAWKLIENKIGPFWLSKGLE